VLISYQVKQYMLDKTVEVVPPISVEVVPGVSVEVVPLQVGYFAFVSVEVVPAA
jgi:hypothetical protein